MDLQFRDTREYGGARQTCIFSVTCQTCAQVPCDVEAFCSKFKISTSLSSPRGTWQYRSNGHLTDAPHCQLGKKAVLDVFRNFRRGASLLHLPSSMLTLGFFILFLSLPLCNVVRR